MKKAAMAARVGNRILSIMAGILILLMLSYGMYSLWDTYIESMPIHLQMKNC